jgi:hypothetical protein
MSIDITSLIGNVATGGLLGLLGNALSFGMNYFKAKQEHGFRMAEMQRQADIQNAKTAGDIAVAREKGAADAFTASIQSDGRVKGASTWVVNLRESTRPVLTHGGLLASIIFGLFSIENALSVTVNCYTGMMIAWWFGQRAMDRSQLSWGNSTTNATISSK